MSIRFPNDSNRLVIAGSTGSGKTQAGIWHLSMRSFDRMPWVIFDFKGDELIAEIGAQEITLGTVPRRAGLYVVRPLPNQGEQVNAYLWQLWSRENVGIFIDEGFMIPSSEALDAILTQGRSKRIPVITLTQRPVWLSRFVFSEAQFFQIFRLTDERDRKTVLNFVPNKASEKLEEFHSFYYDVNRDNLVTFGPVPDRQTIIETFEERTKKRTRLL